MASALTLGQLIKFRGIRMLKLITWVFEKLFYVIFIAVDLSTWKTTVLHVVVAEELTSPTPQHKSQHKSHPPKRILESQSHCIFRGIKAFLLCSKEASERHNSRSRRNTIRCYRHFIDVSGEISQQGMS
jgi:hypothetical protein